ncbi:sorting nexin-21-like [Saccostrea echinata]|uniref:sorting nexin-21-like n=1 Tax=Saccostrea echinata TaxID=191078 RepID=UPI002A813F24|nr:sorting nexin-21-like [Saccostrea echinata]
MSFIRGSRISQGLKQVLDTEEDVQDHFLAAEEEEFDSFHDNLTLKIENQEVSKPKDDRKSAVISISGDNPGTRGVIFEVIKAEKASEGRSSFVKYTLSVSTEGDPDKTPGLIEKRYSDFSDLNTKLKKQFPKYMEHISFPGKLVIGNFTDETIAQRSRAFEQFLTHIFTIDSLRFSDEFKNFLYQEEMQKGVESIHGGDFSHCVTVMEKYLPVQERLQGDQHTDVVCTLCVLSVCHQKLGDRETALEYAESALSCINNDQTCPFLVPLLNHTIYLCWVLCREKSHLEARLAGLRDKGGKSEELLSVILNYTKFDSVWYDDK